MVHELKDILYVEDDEDIALVVTMTLDALSDFNIRHCSSGREALDVFPNFNPQLVILDVMMPGMDGPATLEGLRRIPNAENTPVIFMTAKAQAYEQKRYMELGALGVITKPFDPIDLPAAITDIWEKRDALSPVT